MTLTDAIAWAAMVVAAVAAFFTIMQWRSAERSADAAEVSAGAALASAQTSRTAFEVGQRAWVVHDSTVSQIEPPDEDGMIFIRIASNFMNCGETPAFKMSTGQSFRAMNTFEPENDEWNSPTRRVEQSYK